jgi:PAS domain S-box-containing protein
MRRVNPGRIAALYLVVGAAWVLFSDELLARLVPDPAQRVLFHTAKAWVFVAVSAALLFALIRHGSRGLQRLEQEVRAVIDSMTDGVLVVDQDLRIVTANRSAAELLGRSQEELLVTLGEFAAEGRLRGPNGQPVPLSRYSALQARGAASPRGYEASYLRPDGREVFLTVSAAPVMRESGAGPAQLTVAILRDRTEEKRFDDLREEFFSTAAHEFKTPLAVVKAYAQLIAKRQESERPALETVIRQVERLNRLVQHLLEVSRFRLGNAELHRSCFDLVPLVGEVAERMQAVAAGHRLRFHPCAEARVEADRERVEQVLVNLIDNAFRFSPDGGDVDATVRRRDAEVVVSIRDRGLGIPADRQGHMFERFYRAHAGTPQDYGGLGVGLEMSREIVARHGGRIWFESEPGEGSTFSFSLPLAGGAP